MYITENQSICDSVLFLLAARETLCNIYESSEDINFIKNEASDYQIMNLLLKGSLPEVKYNAEEELKLFSEFKESILINKEFVSEIVGADIFNNILNEVDSIYSVTSTTLPVLSFVSETNKNVNLAYNIYLLNEMSPLERMINNLNNQLLNLGTDLKDAKTPQAAKAIKATMDQVKNKLTTLKTQQASLAGKASFYGKQIGGAIKTAGQKAAGKVAAFSKTKAGMATGGAAAAALAIYAGYKIYKRFFSAAAKACSGKSGAEKTACMNKYKKAALMKQASATQSGISKCSKSKDPAKCKAAIGKKVASLKAKAAAI